MISVLVDIFQGVCRDGLTVLVCCVWYKDLAFSGRIKDTGNKSLDLFTSPLPGKKNGVALTSLPGCNCSCFVHGGELAH